MGKPTGFLEFERADRKYKPVDERVNRDRRRVCPAVCDDRPFANVCRDDKSIGVFA